MALGLTDFSGATVDAQKYIAVSPGLVAVYERDLVLPRGALAYLSDEVDLYAKASAARSDAAGLRRLLSSSGGRTQFGAVFARGLKPLKTKSVSVSRPASISAGELAFRFTITAVTNRGTVRAGFVLIRVHRAVSYLFVVARKGAKVAPAALVSLARAQETHFRTARSAPSRRPRSPARRRRGRR